MGKARGVGRGARGKGSGKIGGSSSRFAGLPIKGFAVRPDFVFRRVLPDGSQGVAVFVDGCFWHGCPKHANLPVNNRAFWRRKLAVNRARDLLVSKSLRKMGWRVVRIWEHELADHRACLRRLRHLRRMG